MKTANKPTTYKGSSYSFVFPPEQTENLFSKEYV
jgi:hypothetical protein